MSQHKTTYERDGSAARRDLLGDERGSVMTEYVIVVAFAGLLVAIGLAAIGPRTVQSYSDRRALLYDSQHP